MKAQEKLWESVCSNLDSLKMLKKLYVRRDKGRDSNFTYHDKSYLRKHTYWKLICYFTYFANSCQLFTKFV